MRADQVGLNKIPSTTGNHPILSSPSDSSESVPSPLVAMIPLSSRPEALEFWGGVYKAVIVLTLGDGLVNGPIHSE